MIALILAVATALALLVLPGPEGVLLAGLITAAMITTALGVTGFAATALAFAANVIIGTIVSFAINKVVAPGDKVSKRRLAPLRVAA